MAGLDAETDDEVLNVLPIVILSDFVFFQALPKLIVAVFVRSTGEGELTHRAAR